MRRTENDCVGCDVCYNCGLKEAEHYYCDECGEEIDDEDLVERNGGDYHRDCWYDKLGYQETLTLENAEKWGEKNTKEVELNGYYAAYFDESEIEELLKREYLDARSKADIHDDIAETAEWDKEAWMHAIHD